MTTFTVRGAFNILNRITTASLKKNLNVWRFSYLCYKFKVSSQIGRNTLLAQLLSFQLMLSLCGRLMASIRPSVRLLTFALTNLHFQIYRFPIIVSRHFGGLAICSFLNQVPVTYFVDFIGQSSLFQCIPMGKRQPVV